MSFPSTGLKSRCAFLRCCFLFLGPRLLAGFQTKAVHQPLLSKGHVEQSSWGTSGDHAYEQEMHCFQSQSFGISLSLQHNQDHLDLWKSIPGPPQSRFGFILSIRLYQWLKPGLSSLFFCKGLNSKYFELCGPSGLSCNYSTPYSTKAAIGKLSRNECDFVPIKPYLCEQVLGWIWSSGCSFADCCLKS